MVRVRGRVSMPCCECVSLIQTLELRGNLLLLALNLQREADVVFFLCPCYLRGCRRERHAVHAWTEDVLIV